MKNKAKQLKAKARNQRKQVRQLKRSFWELPTQTTKGGC